jgi:GNAT superfamily N-acetyltransferase
MPTLALMGTSTRAAYAGAFVERHSAQHWAVFEGPGIYGSLPTDGVSPARLLVTDDLAYDELAGLLSNIRSGMVDVFAEAPRSLDLIRADPRWRGSTSTAMACRDLRSVPELPLSFGLRPRPVRRLPSDAAEGVPLNEAVAVAVAAKQTPHETPPGLTRYLRSLPANFRLFAAVDAGGATRGTSGVRVIGAQATVIFVNTDPSWRRRGIGTAMTATALSEARTAGAQHAYLNASDAGRAIYQKLGFETVAQTTRFLRAV